MKIFNVIGSSGSNSFLASLWSFQIVLVEALADELEAQATLRP